MPDTPTTEDRITRLETECAALRHALALMASCQWQLLDSGGRVYFSKAPHVQQNNPILAAMLRGIEENAIATYGPSRKKAG